MKNKKKVVEFFRLLLSKIKSQNEKVELLKQQKKGLMQKIFSQELRFKDENGQDYSGWTTTTLEKTARIDKGFTPSTNEKELWIGELSWLSIAGMNQGKYIEKGNKNLSREAVGSKTMVPINTLIMSFKLTIGRLAIVGTPVFTNEAICHFYWKDSSINTEYMYYYLSSLNISSFGSRAAKGITLNNDSLNSIVVKLPTNCEQEKIARILKLIDEKIYLEKEKLNYFILRKQGFMQQMFI